MPAHRCECGGRIRIKDGAQTPNGTVSERYECETCGRTGTLRIDGVTGATTTSGCLTTEARR
jgi:DNA-directed RNA polymerase subunit RPC12/RpoP